MVSLLVLRDVAAPGDGAAGLAVLLQGDVDDEAVRGGAVPVVLAGLEEDAVAGADDLVAPPSRWQRPMPSVTKMVCPRGWVCHAVRAPRVKCTRAAANVEVPAGAGTASM